MIVDEGALRSVCTYDLGQDSPIQTDLARLIRANYYIANPVLGKSLCSDWFFLGQDFAVRTVSMETVQPVYFSFGAKPANSNFGTKTAKKIVNIVIRHSETTRIS